MSEKLGEVVIEITSKKDKFERDLNAIQKDTEKTANKMQKKLSNAFNKFDTGLGKKKISELRVMAKRFQSQLDRKIRLDVSSQSIAHTKKKLKSVENAMHGIKTSAKSSAKGFKAAWLGVMAAVAVGMGALRAGFRAIQGAKNAARDAREIETKYLTVFSNVEDKARKMSKSFASSFGLAESSAQEMLGSTGDLLVGFGFTEDAALSMSEQVNALAVDLASFQNLQGGSVRASKALTSAILGETESSKSLGIQIRQDTPAFRENIKLLMESEGLTQKQAKATLILKQAYEQSKKSVGDFARTQHELANQERIASEEAKKLKEQIGAKLGPTFLAGTKLAISFFRSLTETDLEKSIRQLKELGVATKDLGNLQLAVTYLSNIKEEKRLRKEINKEVGAAQTFKLMKELRGIKTGWQTVEQRTEMVRVKTKQLLDLTTDLAEIQSRGEKNKKLSNRVKAAQDELTAITKIFTKLEAIEKIEQSKIDIKEILRVKSAEELLLIKQAKEAEEKRLALIAAQNKARKEFAPDKYYNDLKFLADGYYEYRVNLINEDAKAILKNAKGEIDIEKWKNEQLKELNKERKEYQELQKAGLAGPTPKQELKMRGVAEEKKKDPLVAGLDGKDFHEMFPMEKLDEEADGDPEVLFSRWENASLDAASAFGDAFVNASSVIGSELSNMWDDTFGEANSVAEKFIKSFTISMLSSLAEIAASEVLKELASILFPGGGAIVKAVTGAASGGSFYGGDNGIVKMASGGSFDVPRGFNNDSYLMGVQSGEDVTVRTPLQRSAEGLENRQILSALNKINQNFTASQRGEDSIYASAAIAGDELRVMVEKSQDRVGRYS